MSDPKDNLFVKLAQVERLLRAVSVYNTIIKSGECLRVSLLPDGSLIKIGNKYTNYIEADTVEDAIKKVEQQLNNFYNEQMEKSKNIEEGALKVKDKMKEVFGE